jgi:hypothetical protein
MASWNWQMAGMLATQTIWNPVRWYILLSILFYGSRKGRVVMVVDRHVSWLKPQ